MEIKIKYQYTYFIYPYVVNEKKYDKYLLKLLHNKNCELKMFEQEKNLDLYTYFLPKIRNYMFWSFDFNNKKMKQLEQFDNNMKSVLLAKYPCVIFEYKIKKDIQGKTKNDGIFFNIRKIEIICFNTGICFLNIKTTLDEDSTLEDLCNFNYKFRNINSSIAKLKEYENIKIQADAYKNVKGIPQLIKEIAENNIEAKELNIDIDKFVIYSYACIGQECWENNTNIELLEKELYKYSNLYPVDYNSSINTDLIYELEQGKHTKFAFNSTSTVLLTSDANTDNYTKLPHIYETQYLYNYIYELHKKIFLNKLDKEAKNYNKFNNIKEQFIQFVQNVWIEETTNNNMGNEITKYWKKALKTDKVFEKVKQKYDIIYKSANIEKNEKSNKWIIISLIVLALINIANYISILHK